VGRRAWLRTESGLRSAFYKLLVSIVHTITMPYNISLGDTVSRLFLALALPRQCGLLPACGVSLLMRRGGCRLSGWGRVRGTESGDRSPKLRNH
jgi:hypothetical protein